MRRFSIRTSDGSGLHLRVGMAAFRGAGDLWGGILLLVALASVGLAVMGSDYLARQRTTGGPASRSSVVDTWHSPSVPGSATHSSRSSGQRICSNKFAGGCIRW